MSLTKKLIAGTFTLASLFNGCSTLPEITREFPEGHISGVEYKSIDQSKSPYKLEDQVIYDKRYYLQEIGEMKESLPMLFYPWDKTQREMDLDSGKMKLNPKEMYLPRLVEIADGKKDKWADWITLTSTGTYGIKAYMTSLEALSKRKTESNGIGYKIITTEDDASFIVPTMTILEREYFVILVEDKKMDEKGKLPFRMIPTKGAKIRIDNVCGNLSIYNENQVYRPVLIKESELNNYNRIQGTIMDDIEAYREQNPTPVPTSVPTPTPSVKKKNN